MPDLGLVSSYDYDLPEELIAQAPCDRRDGSRLMVLLAGGVIEHRRFFELPEILRAGDLLVMNDTRVLAARATGRRLPGGGRTEVLFLRPARDGVWEALVRPGRKLAPGTSVELAGGVTVTIDERTPGGGRSVRLPDGVDEASFFARCGELPLPPYIRARPNDPERYQTVYGDAAKTRSCAAPTAGLHFTPELLARLDASGISSAFITLDVGLGTFRPVRAERVRDHEMHSERCEVSAEAAAAINAARREGRRVVAVGTTSVRAIESFADEGGLVSPGSRDTDIFIAPGRELRAVDAMITNFHLPRSTLLMLVAAFAGHGRVMSAYREAVAERYRFFSFGDAMLIERPAG